MLYHRTATVACDEVLVELIDYCYRKFVGLTEKCSKLPEGEYLFPSKPVNIRDTTTNLEADQQRNLAEIEFTCVMTCFSIIRFISDHTESLAVPIIHQMMENNDIPCVLVPLLELRPWIRVNHKGEEEKFEDQKWQVIKEHDKGKVTKVEAQIWLTIYNMFMTADSSRKYEITTFRKQNLLRLRKYMNEMLLDQLPMLTPMLRGLEEMNLMADTNVQSKNSFIVQTLPEIRSRLLAGKNWN